MSILSNKLRALLYEDIAVQFERTEARLADTEAQLERESALLTEAKRQNSDLMAIIDKRDEALGFIPLDKGMDMQDELREANARLAEAEKLILRMAGEGYQRATFYVEEYDLTGERAADSADDVINAQHDETGRTWRGPRSQLPRRYFEITSICCLDYPLCDCNSPPEPDDDWLCFQRPAQPKVTP